MVLQTVLVMRIFSSLVPRPRTRMLTYSCLERPRRTTGSGLQHQLTLTTSDGRDVPLPEGTEGIVVTNIASYGGGSHLWVQSHTADGANSVIMCKSEEWCVWGGGCQ
jgi:hypothetical protein